MSRSTWGAPEPLGCRFGRQIAAALPFIPRARVEDLFGVLVRCRNGPHDEAERGLEPLHDLAEGKASDGPDELFHRNHNIAPAISA